MGEGETGMREGDMGEGEGENVQSLHLLNKTLQVWFLPPSLPSTTWGLCQLPGPRLLCSSVTPGRGPVHPGLQLPR